MREEHIAALRDIAAKEVQEATTEDDFEGIRCILKAINSSLCTANTEVDQIIQKIQAASPVLLPLLETVFKTGLAPITEYKNQLSIDTAALLLTSSQDIGPLLRSRLQQLLLEHMDNRLSPIAPKESA